MNGEEEFLFQKDLEDYFQDVPPISQDFTARIMEKIKKEDKRKNRVWSSPWLKAASVAVILGGLSLYVANLSHSPSVVAAKKNNVQLAKVEQSFTPSAIPEAATDGNTTPEVTKKIPVEADKVYTATEYLAKENKSQPEKSQDYAAAKTREVVQPNESVPSQETASQGAAREVPSTANSDGAPMMSLMAAKAKNAPIDQKEEENEAVMPVAQYLPTGYLFAHGEVKENQDKSGSIMELYYLPEGTQYTNESLLGDNYIHVTVAIGIPDKKPQISVQSKGIEQDEVVKLVNSLVFQAQTSH